MTLYHRACSHLYDAIGKRGTLLPGPNIWGPTRLAWLSHDPRASREDLGLTSTLLRCDRMAYLYRTVGPHTAIRWLGSSYRGECDPQWVALVESAGRPELWWVTEHPARVRLCRGGEE